MSEQQVVSETQAVETNEIDYKALYEQTKSDLDKVAAHKDKLYQETKKAKAEREATIKEAERIAEEKAMKDGEYEKLWQTTKQEKEILMKQLNELKNFNRQEKIQVNAMRIATELADGDNAELLSEFVVRNLERLADEHGSLSDDVVEAVKTEFKSNKKYSSLLRASKATGGGATGNTRGAQEVNTMTRDAFSKMRPDQQMAFIKKGGRLTDN